VDSRISPIRISIPSYNLLPNKILSDTLGQHFNKAMDIALQTISFIPVKNGNLVKVKDAIVDFTFYLIRITLVKNQSKNY
jgi:hypothetical protein